MLTRRPGVIRAAGSAKVLTLGSFDGLHRGHLEVLAALRERRKALGEGARSVLITFYPHPAEVLGKSQALLPIATLRQRLKILNSEDVDFCYPLRFSSQLAGLSAAEFMELYLRDRLGVQELVLGSDAAIGRGRCGDLEWIKSRAESWGWRVTVVPFRLADGRKIGSSNIRELLISGNVKAAARLLGRWYTLEGQVSVGDQIGRQLGFPTANIIASHQLVPAHGVYAGWCYHQGVRYGAVVNIGVRPTFGGASERIEAHLLGEEVLDLYGARLELKLVERLRSEQRFSNRSDLIRQIRLDVDAATRLLVEQPQVPLLEPKDVFSGDAN